MTKILLFVLMAHMTGDYLFQSDYLARNKGKDNYILLAHSVLYTVGVMIVAYIMDIELSSIGLLILSNDNIGLKRTKHFMSFICISSNMSDLLYPKYINNFLDGWKSAVGVIVIE